MSTPVRGESLGRRAVNIEFNDGTTTQVISDSPLVVYKFGKLGVPDDIMGGFIGLWIAAGEPGLNGDELTPQTAERLTEAWLATVKAVDALEETGRPPTKRARK